MPQRLTALTACKSRCELKCFEFRTPFIVLKCPTFAPSITHSIWSKTVLYYMYRFLETRDDQKPASDQPNRHRLPGVLYRYTGTWYCTHTNTTCLWLDFCSLIFQSFFPFHSHLLRPTPTVFSVACRVVYHQKQCTASIEQVHHSHVNVAKPKAQPPNINCLTWQMPVVCYVF